MPSPGRFVGLIVHDDGEVLDLLTRLFEVNDFEVVTAINFNRALAHLESERSIDVVIAPWDDSHGVGGEVYRWVLQHRAKLRNRFVFIAAEVPAAFDALVGGRCLSVLPGSYEELVRIALAVGRRVRTPPMGVPVLPNRPSLLLADDDPALLEVMAELLFEAGYAVTEADSGQAAMTALAGTAFDAIVIDWQMHDGAGAEVYRWIAEHRPELATRVVFLSDTDSDDSSRVAPGRPMFRKGHNSQALTDMLREIVRTRGK